MKIGIIGAMLQEITELLNKIKNVQTLTIAGYNIYTGIINNIEVALIKAGIGKTSATIGTTLLLTIWSPDFIINIGAAGSLSSKLKIGDIVISDEVCYHDVNLTLFGYKHGQIAGYPAVFIADQNLIDIAEIVVNKLNFKAMRGLIVSGDSFIYGIKEIESIFKIFPKAIAVEMEATAVGQVCYQFNIPFVVIRAISDSADQEAQHSFNKFLNFAAKQSSAIVENIIIHINNI